MFCAVAGHDSDESTEQRAGLDGPAVQLPGEPVQGGGVLRGIRLRVDRGDPGLPGLSVTTLTAALTALAITQFIVADTTDSSWRGLCQGRQLQMH